MDDVELLIQTFYEYSDRHKMEQKQELDGSIDLDGKKRGDTNRDEYGEEEKVEGQDSEDENLEVDMDEIVDILRDFHKRREDRANNAELLGNPRMKKRSNFETEEQKKERIKREERIFWEKMTTVLNDQKQGLWRALDKALSNYYSLLMDR